MGIWTTASRRKARVLESEGGTGVETGPYVQVSRLGNPLFNEVLVPLSQKDTWNAQPPKDDKQYASGVAHPELAGLLNVLYPGAFPNLAAYTKPRADLEAILLTGIPAGVVSSTFSTFTGTTVGRHAATQPRDPASLNAESRSACSAVTSRASRTDGASPTTS